MCCPFVETRVHETARRAEKNQAVQTNGFAWPDAAFFSYGRSAFFLHTVTRPPASCVLPLGLRKAACAGRAPEKFRQLLRVRNAIPHEHHARMAARSADTRCDSKGARPALRVCVEGVRACSRSGQSMPCQRETRARGADGSDLRGRVAGVGVRRRGGLWCSQKAVDGATSRRRWLVDAALLH